MLSNVKPVIDEDELIVGKQSNRNLTENEQIEFQHIKKYLKPVLNSVSNDQDRSFGVENICQAFNQIRVLVENGYSKNAEYVGLDVKAMRTTKDEAGDKHL